MSSASKHDYAALFEEYDYRLAGGESPKAIRASFDARGINWGTFQNRRTQAKKAHRNTPDEPELWAVHHGTPERLGVPHEHLDMQGMEHPSTPEYTAIPEHPGTLEGHQEVIEDIQESIPDVPHLSTDEAHPSVPELTDSDEVHPSTPEVRQELSQSHSRAEHFAEHPSVPARQAHDISTPMVHPGTPMSEDWELWTTIKERWKEVEKMLSDRQALLSTPSTPGHTQKKTYVFDVRHVGLIEAYAEQHRVELKDVIYAAFEEFFQRR